MLRHRRPPAQLGQTMAAAWTPRVRNEQTRPGEKCRGRRRRRWQRRRWVEEEFQRQRWIRLRFAMSARHRLPWTSTCSTRRYVLMHSWKLVPGSTCLSVSLLLTFVSHDIFRSPPGNKAFQRAAVYKGYPVTRLPYRQMNEPEKPPILRRHAVLWRKASRGMEGTRPIGAAGVGEYRPRWVGFTMWIFSPQVIRRKRTELLCMTSH